MIFQPESVKAFRYTGYEIDVQAGELTCHYALDELEFVEKIAVPGGDWMSLAASEAARLVYLLAGISYYKAAAPDTVDLGDTPVWGDGEAEFLRTFYLEGLGEYAYRNQLDLSGLRFVGGKQATEKAPFEPNLAAPLIPFGGGIDSIVTVESVRNEHAGAALFVMDRKGDHFAAIESAAAVTGLPIVRAERQIDPKILRSAELGFRNGHVPVTGILSAVAVLTAVVHGRGAVVMSNEWSASMGNIEVDGRTINHQFSKSARFEAEFRTNLQRMFTTPPQYFSLLRSFSELLIARRFAELAQYHSVFRSCNRAFRIDPTTRYDKWCGECDKCCFIDLILSPFMSRSALEAVFNGSEPLAKYELMPVFEALVATSEDIKPFECVGDVDECRTAAVMAAAREDREGSAVLKDLIARFAGPAEARARNDIERLMRPLDRDNVPSSYAPQDLVR